MQNVTLKVIMVGDSRVGKSQLCRRVTNRSFEENAQTTVGMEFAKRSFDFEKSVVVAQVWNTAGEDRYDGMMKSYYRNAAACVLVYDIGCRDTFLNIRKVWLKNVQCQGSEDLRMILVGNKIDIADKQQTLRQVTTDEGLELAKQLNMDFVETSALTGQGVECAFRRVVLSVAMKIPQISVQLEVSYLPHGWMIASSPMVIPLETSTVDAAVDTTESYSVMHSCNAVSINGINNNSHHSNSSCAGSQSSSSSGPNSINSFSMSMSSVDRHERKSMAFTKNRYINYWTGAETNELPLAYAPTGLLFVQKELKKVSGESTNSIETAQSTERTSSTHTIVAMSITTSATCTGTGTGETQKTKKSNNNKNNDDDSLSLSQSRKRNHRTPLRCMNSCCVIA